MKRAAIFVAILSALIASYSLLVRASLPQVPSNTWSATGDMVVGRAGASAVLLQDGRVLVTGGTNEGGASASVERYSPNAGGFLATPSMENARANHSSTRLQDGRVLVIGGVGVDGHAVASAELYDPNANAWAPAATLNHARSGHTATLLSDGRVLVAGGDDSGVADATLEVFDPFSSIFSPLDAVLSAPRTGHAAASLSDGRVLIVGGFDGMSALASVDVFDPTAMAVTAGPSLTTARAGHSATTLLDGRVLIAGGASDSSELASAEIFDPSANTFTAAGNALAVARQRHAALLLPHNNNVLIVGGTSGGNAVATAELYTPWEGNGGTFCATTVCGSGYAGPSAPNAARAWATGAALSVPADDTIRTGPADGLLLIAGGSATSSATTPTKSAELYGFATVKTDKEDYAPGTMVTISGSGWKPGEWVALLLKEYPEYDEHQLVDVQADESGDIVSTEFVPDQHDVGIRFYLTAFGEQSQAQTTFRDNENLTAVSVAAQSPSPITPGNSATYVVTVSFQKVGGNATCIADLTVTGLTSGAAGSFSPTFLTASNGDSILTSTLTVSTTAAVAAGTTSFTITSSGRTGTSCASQVKTATGTLVVKKAASIINVSATNGAPGGSTSLGAKLVDAVTNNAISGETISFTINGVASGSDVTNGGGNASATGTLPAAPGTYPVVAGFSGDSTYGPATGSTTVTVGAPATTLIVGSASGTYGGTTSLSATLTQTSGGSAVSGKTVSFTLNGGSIGTGTTNSSGVATLASASLSGINAGVYATGVGASYAGDSSFAASAGNNSLTVNQKPLTVTGITATNKVYDRTTGATLNTGSAALVGVLAGDVGSVTLNTASASGTFADRNVGTGKTVTVSGLTISGSKASNYSLTQPTTTANITAKGLTVTGITAGNKTYDRTTTATLNTASASLVGVIGADAVTLNAASAAGAFADKNVGTGKAVTVSGLTIEGTDSGNYSLAQPTPTADITAKGLTVSGITANNKVYDGTTTAILNTGSASLVGVISGDTVMLSSASASGAFADKTVGSAKTVTVSGLTISGSDSGNYTLAQPSTSAEITAKNLTVSGVTASNKVYDGNTTATLNTGSAALAGVIGGDLVTLNVASASGAFADKSVAVGKAVTVTGLTLGAADAGNYSLSQPSGITATIDPRNLTVSGAAAVSRPYDGTTVAALNFTGASLVDVIASDVVTIDHASAAGAFADKNVGTNKPVTVTGVALSGAGAGNYTVSQPTGLTANITAVNLTATIAASDKDYDGTATATISSCALSGVVGSEAVSCTTSNAHFGSVNASASAQTVTADIVLAGPDAGNYTVTTPATTTARINPKALTATIAASDKDYDGNTTATITSCALSGVVGSEAVSCTTSNAHFASVNASSSPQTVTADVALAGADAGNYTLTSPATTSAKINRKAASVTPNAANKTYGTADPSFSGTLSGFVAADSVSASYSRTAGDTVAGSPYTISAALSPAGVLGNYAITYNTANFTIDKAVASVAANAASKTYGTADPGFSGTLSGFVAADGVTASYSRTAGDTVASSPYTISAALTPPGVLGNYTITYNTAPFTIDKAIASVTPNAANKTYGTADPGFSGTLSGFVAADGVTASYSRTAGETVAGGPYAISAALSPAGVLGNYTITYNPASFTIDKAIASVTPNAANKTYGTADPGFSGTLSGFVAADGVTASYSRTAGETVADGPYTISAVLSPAGVLGNYTITSSTASFTIDKAIASVTPNAASKTYGTADPGFSGTLSGFVAADGVTAAYSRTAGETVAGGPYTISAVLSPAGVLGNYTITSSTASFTIDKAIASVTPNAAGKTYGTGDPALSGNLAGFVASDGVTASYSRAAGETVAGGPYAISAALSPAGVLGNYTIAYNIASFTIAARSLTVTAAGTSRVYDGTTNATVTLSDDHIAGDALTISYTSASFADKNKGTAKPVNVIGISVTGTAAGNYTFNTTASASADITARLITVAAGASSKIYDATTASSGTPAISLGTLASGDTLNFTQTYDNKNVGTAKMLTPAGVVSDGNGGHNYAVTLATNTAGIITARSLTVTATGIDKLYDGTTTATVTLSDNRVGGDALTDSYASASFANKNFGNKTVTVSGIAISGADAGNYALSSTTATTTATITKKPLTVTAVTDSRIYDGTVASNKVPLISTSLAVGDTASLAETFDTKDVGTGKTMKPTAVVNDGNSGDNYAVTLVNNLTGVIGAWSLKGFYQPVTMSSGAMVYNTIKGGSTVPLKFNVYAGVGGAEQTNTSAVQSFVLQAISCTAGIEDPIDDTFATTGGTTLRYDSTAGQFINNWQSPKIAGKCYAVTMTAQDNSTLVAYFKTK
jgi:hypothetical protein